MKRVCKRKIMIDALTVCFEVESPYHYDQLKELELGECYDLYEFKLYRIEGRYYNNVYSISAWNGDRAIDFGQLKFNLNNGKHVNGLSKVWISLNNETLYSDDSFFLDYIATKLGLVPHNITTLDLCLDTGFNVSKVIKKHIRDKSITTILNGKKLNDRNKDRPEITYTLSGSLDKDKYLTVYIKQRKAMKDKSKGVTVVCYDKAAEVKNSSEKDYILDYYGCTGKLFRTEVHLNNEELKDYMESRGLEFTYWTLADEALLEAMFFYHLNSVIRFQKGRKDIKWEQLLGRV